MRIGTGTSIFDGMVDTIKSRIDYGISQNGFYDFKLEKAEFKYSDDSSKVDLTLTVQEGDFTLINKIIFTTIDSIDSLNIFSFFKYLEGSIFISQDVEVSIIEILDYYEDDGFPFCSVKIESIFFYEDTTDQSPLADIYLHIDKGLKSSFDKVEIIGNTKTKDYVLIRNLRLNKGEKYSQGRINKIPKQLNRMRFFEPVQVPSFYINSINEGVLQISVKEKETNNFDGIVGYVPGREDEKGYFTGFVNVSLRNLFGTGRAAAIRWQQEDRYSQELELKYLEPWILSYPFNIEVGLFQRKQDTSYVQRRFNGSVEFLATEDISASLLFAAESIIPSESDSNRFTVFNSSSILTGINLKIDTRDDVYAPTEGLLFLNTYKFNAKKINGPKNFITPDTKTNINLQMLELDFSYFYELFNRQIAALGIHAKELRGDFFEISDLYKLGGTNTLRGFRENQFLGNRIFWSNLEYRYLLSRRSFAFLFFDTGYFLKNEDKLRNIEKVSSFKTGYGLGLSLETALGVMKVSYALAGGNSFSEGLIHFGLLNEF
jgi:outer membrane protein insertion porin family